LIQEPGLRANQLTIPRLAITKFRAGDRTPMPSDQLSGNVSQRNSYQQEGRGHHVDAPATLEPSRSLSCLKLLGSSKFPALTIESTAGATIGGACASARSSAGPVWRLKLSAQLISPT
jgi:hypothetical protein